MVVGHTSQDVNIRIAALDAAARVLSDTRVSGQTVVTLAELFEAFLRFEKTS